MAVDEEIFTWFKLLDQGQTVAIEEENFNPFISMDQKKNHRRFIYMVYTDSPKSATMVMMPKKPRTLVLQTAKFNGLEGRKLCFQASRR